MKNIRHTLAKINISGSVAYDEPMALHTSFKVGGNADAFIIPADVEDIRRVRDYAWAHEIPVFPLGAGANILVSDRGIRGIVVDTSRLNGIYVTGDTVQAEAGAAMSDASEAAMKASLGGLSFIYAMPGSVGGSVWMNARCYDSSISDVLSYVDILDESNSPVRYTPHPEDFSYKRSPFMGKDQFILGAGFLLTPADPDELSAEMQSHSDDREKKGHFSYPCAGSVFKNNRAFGSPTGQIIDSLGLKGRHIGGAFVSPVHGNIIMSDGSASAAEILSLIELVEKTVAEKTGFTLEREIIPVGDWG